MEHLCIALPEENSEEIGRKEGELILEERRLFLRDICSQGQRRSVTGDTNWPRKYNWPLKFELESPGRPPFSLVYF